MRHHLALLCSALLVTSGTALAGEVLLPSVTGRAIGAFQSDWASEIRVTNLSLTERTFAVTDWIGSPGWRPKTWLVPPGQVVSISGFEIFTDPNALPYNLPYFGAAIATIDEGLIVQVAILSDDHFVGALPADGGGICPTWAGGYLGHWEECNHGAGPVIDATSFFPADRAISLLWLSTDSGHRTNVCLINPDPVNAEVSIDVFSADGTLVTSDAVQVTAHGLLQLDDVFGSRWRPARSTNGTSVSAARAVVYSPTRLYPLAWVISNRNNTVSVSLPRLSP